MVCKRVGVRLGLVGIVVALLAGMSLGQYSGGAGTEGDPYQIATAADLIALGENTGDYDKHFIMTSDIDLAGAGSGEDGVFTQALLAPLSTKPFTGIFDGGGHIIHNLEIFQIGSNFTGLCGLLGLGGQINNIGLEKVVIRGDNYVGSICGYCEGEIFNSYVRGTVNGSGWGDYVGGLCGRNYGIIRRCYSYVSVKNSAGRGGFCGSNSLGIITESYSVGQVSGKYTESGGFCDINSGTIEKCFWNIETSGQSISSGGTGLTTAEMLDMQVYLDAGWDFGNDGEPADWMLYEGYYPTLVWQPEIFLPDVVGCEWKETETELTDSGFCVEFQEEMSVDVPAGYIIRQYPTGNQEVAAGLTVKLVISRGLPCAGSGTEQDPYQIETIFQWKWLTETPEVWDKHFILTANLDFKGMEIQQIGRFLRTLVYEPFSGVIEGNGHVMKQIKMVYPGNLTYYNEGFGLFAFLDGAVIRNLGLMDFDMTLGTNVYHIDAGCLAGHISDLEPYTNGAIIENCYVTGKITGSINDGGIGGLIGSNRYGKIKNCYSDCVIDVVTPDTSGYTASLVGYSITEGSLIERSFWNIEKEANGVGYTRDTEVVDNSGLTAAMMSDIGLYLNYGWDFIGETQNGAEDIWHMPWGQDGPPKLWNEKDIPGDVAGRYGVDLADLDRLSADWLRDDSDYQFDGVSGSDGCVDTVELGMIADNWLVQPELGEKVSLVSHWPFDVDGVDVERGIEVVMKNGATLVHDQGDFRIGTGSVKFDGVDDLLECVSEETLTDSKCFSVAMWINVNQIIFSRTMHIIGQRDGTDHLWSLQLWGANEAHLTGFVGGTSGYALTETSYTPIRNSWIHVAMIYNDYGDRMVHLYINGEEVSTVQQVAVEGELQSNGSIPMTFGDRIGGGRAFAGMIDDVVLTQRILSEYEIDKLAELYAPISYWPFDTDGRDEKNRNEAVLQKGASISQISGEYRIGQGALKLDGEDDIAVCRTVGIPKDSTAFSVALWFKADEVSEDKTVQLIGQRDLSEHVWSLQIWGANSRHLTGFVGGSSGNALTETAFVPEVGRWYHVVMDYNDASGRMVHIYVDGVEVDTIQQTALTGVLATKNTEVKSSMGDRIGGTRALSGSLDDVRIYPRILSTGEIAKLAGMGG